MSKKAAVRKARDPFFGAPPRITQKLGESCHPPRTCASHDAPFVEMRSGTSRHWSYLAVAHRSVNRAAYFSAPYNYSDSRVDRKTLE